jgi:hypothetical protein
MLIVLKSIQEWSLILFFSEKHFFRVRGCDLGDSPTAKDENEVIVSREYAGRLANTLNIVANTVYSGV